MTSLESKYRFIEWHSDHNEDFSSAYLMPVAYLIKEKDNRWVGVSEAAQCLRDEYRIEITEDVIISICRRSELFSFDKKSRTISIEKPDRVDVLINSNDNFAFELHQLISAIQKKLPQIENVEVVLDCFISKYAKTQFDSISNGCVEQIDDEASLANYLENISVNNVALFAVFERLVAASVYCQLLVVGAKNGYAIGKNKTIYLDSNYILRILGLQDELLNGPARRTLSLIKEAGFDVVCLSETLQELQELVLYAIYDLEKIQGNGVAIAKAAGRYTQGIVGACLDKGINAQSLYEISTNIESKLLEIDIRIIRQSIGDYTKSSRFESLFKVNLKREATKYNKRKLIETTSDFLSLPDNFESLIKEGDYSDFPEELVNKANRQTSYHLYLVDVIRAKRGKYVYKFSDSNSFVVTCNHRLKGWAENKGSQSEVLLDYELAEIIWILNPKVDLSFTAKTALMSCLRNSRFSVDDAIRITKMSEEYGRDIDEIVSAIFYNADMAKRNYENRDAAFKASIDEIINNPNKLGIDRRSKRWSTNIRLSAVLFIAFVAVGIMLALISASQGWLKLSVIIGCTIWSILRFKYELDNEDYALYRACRSKIVSGESWFSLWLKYFMITTKRFKDISVFNSKQVIG